jgi:hypothetical protein
MEQIVYISTPRTEPDGALIDNILVSSRRNNRRDSLTGLLVVGKRRFLQVLEGPKEQCDATYDRILADDRHFAVVQLSRRTIEERAFGEWDMGFKQANGESLVDVVHGLTARLKDSSLQAQFRSFAELHGDKA